MPGLFDSEDGVSRVKLVIAVRMLACGLFRAGMIFLGFLTFGAGFRLSFGRALAKAGLRGGAVFLRAIGEGLAFLAVLLACFLVAMVLFTFGLCPNPFKAGENRAFDGERGRFACSGPTLNTRFKWVKTGAFKPFHVMPLSSIFLHSALSMALSRCLVT